MALSTKTNIALIDALASKTAAAAFVAAVNARSIAALTTDQKSRIIEMCSGPKAGAELLASIASGATLSVRTARRIIVGMAGDGVYAAGNELINFVQSTPNAKKINL